MATTADFKNGLYINFNGKPCSIVYFQHVKPGKGAAFVRTKIKNIMTGAVVEKSFSPTEKFPRAHIDTKEMQYLYNDDDIYYFMDAETYDQIPLNKDSVEDALNFVKENENCTMYFYKGNPFAVYAPNFVELEVIDCEPGIQGDTSKSTTKPAKVETGYVIQVPLFVNIGDKIRIDTRTGEYLERI